MIGVFHTGITVSDLEHAISFYRDILGLELIIGPTEVFEGDDLSAALGVRGARVKLAIMKIGDSSLELHQYLSPKSEVDRAMPPNTLGFMHVAFRVENIEQKVRELEAKGIRFLSQVNVVYEGPLAGWKWIYLKDPDGITLELVEHNPLSEGQPF
jgi:catechol 2,3-dioxygenase-like lactoylglutathione lyase family enzyme